MERQPREVVVAKAAILGSIRRAAGVAMVAALVGAVVVFVVLAGAGPASFALGIAAGAAVVACVVVCVASGIAGSRAVAEVDAAWEAFTAERAGRTPPGPDLRVCPHRHRGRARMRRAGRGRRMGDEAQRRATSREDP